MFFYNVICFHNFISILSIFTDFFLENHVFSETPCTSRQAITLLKNNRLRMAFSSPAIYYAHCTGSKNRTL